MSLDPQAVVLLKQMEAAALPATHTLTPDAARDLFAKRALAGDEEPVASVTNQEVPVRGGFLRIRIYRPTLSDTRLPALVYFHGGGWVVGSVDTTDVPCRSIANRAQCVVISVDYRLAPEYPFPTAAEDGYEVTRWVANHAKALAIDANRIAVGGDSAGGNIAAAVTLMTRDAGGPSLVYQLLIYPVTDLTSTNTASYNANASGYYLTKDTMRWYIDHYVPNAADRKNPLASPLHAHDLTGLPAALVITAEYDPLRDEGEAYATKLKHAGVPVTHRRFEGMIHGFFCMGGVLNQGKTAVQLTADVLAQAF